MVRVRIAVVRLVVKDSESPPCYPESNMVRMETKARHWPAQVSPHTIARVLQTQIVIKRGEKKEKKEVCLEVRCFPYCSHRYGRVPWPRSPRKRSNVAFFQKWVKKRGGKKSVKLAWFGVWLGLGTGSYEVKVRKTHKVRSTGRS